MTYKEHFVAEVKCNGHILRIKDGYVTLPFGSEYSLLLKNLNSRKASVKIQIDGQDVLDDSSLIIEPNGTSELEGFMRGMSAKNKFRFIKKTQEIIEHRGDKIDDGLIRIEFAYEKEPPVIRQIISSHHRYYDYYHYPWEPYYPWPKATWTYDNNQDGTSKKQFSDDVQTYNCSSMPQEVTSKSLRQSDLQNAVKELSTPMDDLGITVKGSEIDQQFSYGYIGSTDLAQVIIIQLKGTKVEGTPVTKPVTVKTRLTCSTCGKNSKSSFKFCPDCGTFLE